MSPGKEEDQRTAMSDLYKTTATRITTHHPENYMEFTYQPGNFIIV